MTCQHDWTPQNVRTPQMTYAVVVCLKCNTLKQPLGVDGPITFIHEVGDTEVSKKDEVTPVSQLAPEMGKQDAKDLLEAVRVLVKENVEDYVYAIRERAPEVPGKSFWEAPSVIAFGAACATLDRIVKKYGSST